MLDLIELLGGPAPPQRGHLDVIERLGGPAPPRSEHLDVIERLGGPPPARVALEPAPPFLILESRDDPGRLAAYHRLRRDEFVTRQGLFAHTDLDAVDDDPATRVLVALGRDGAVLGGVRVHPAAPGSAALGMWRGSRLVCRHPVGHPRAAVGAALVRAACAVAAELGALRFDATVQTRHEAFFTRLGWDRVATTTLTGSPHVVMRWPITRFAALAATFKREISPLVGDLLPQDRWRGDDAYPLGGSDLVTSVDAITPSMVEQDPEWAGWCGVLVTAHDLAAMGAAPVAALDALGARDRAHAAQIIRGVRAASEAFALPIVGGHTQLGVPAALAMTGLGRTADPVPAGGGRAGDVVSVTADLSGGWRPGYSGRQWDSTSGKGREELTAMLATVANHRPHAAKDVSMAGIVGTAGMLAEASGCGVELNVADIPCPADARRADWLTCFPGYAVISADAPDAPPIRAVGATSARCGVLTVEPGVRLRWPDGEVTTAIADSHITGLGAAHA
jgi:putative N-acetyltransferase (TIGR04045 family)